MNQIISFLPGFFIQSTNTSIHELGVGFCLAIDFFLVSIVIFTMEPSYTPAKTCHGVVSF